MMSQSTRLRGHKNSTEAGFTLTEILVTILIIGILISIAVPIFINQRKKANDAVVRADVKDAALQIETAIAEQGSYDAISAAIGITGSEATIYVNSDPEIKVPKDSAIYWNDSGKLPPLHHTDGTYMEIIRIPADMPTSHWVKHDYNSFCVIGTHRDGKKYNWKTGSGAVSYDKYLYYDSKLGGITEPQELFDAVRGKTDAQAAEISACHGYGIRYNNV